MRNLDVQRELDNCWTELNQVTALVGGLGITSHITPYLTKYSLIRACGSIELSFKTIIADYCAHRSKKQVKRFLTQKVRDASANPSYDNMCKFLHDFDSDWKKIFKNRIKSRPDKSQLLLSLQSLVDARNDFAHGGNPTASIGDVVTYFGHARQLIEIMDDIVG
jgi:hypothetical protein